MWRWAESIQCANILSTIWGGDDQLTYWVSHAGWFEFNAHRRLSAFEILSACNRDSWSLDSKIRYYSRHFSFGIHWYLALLPELFNSASVCGLLLAIVYKLEFLCDLCSQCGFKVHHSVWRRYLSYQFERVDKLAKIRWFDSELGTLFLCHQWPIYNLKSKLLNKIKCTDLAGMVKELGDKKSTSLSMTIIYFLISTACGNGFSKVINLFLVSLTKLDNVIVSIGSAAVTVKF